MSALVVFVMRILLILLIYIFLGWIAIAIYKDIKSSGRSQETKNIPTLTLNLIHEPDMISKNFEIPEILLGRDPACDFVLSDERVSSQHCKLSYEQKQWWVEDLDSTNGSYLNNFLITSKTVLTDQDELKLGGNVINLRFYK
jgi:pSer/pThr/pTyr-binding forkhead associated (FHA) protein